MSNARRSIAQLRAEKEIRQQIVLEGVKLLDHVSQVINEHGRSSVLIEEPSLATVYSWRKSHELVPSWSTVTLSNEE